MQKAATLLQQGECKLIDVARSVGYDSDAAFSKAFKRAQSVPPSYFRRRSPLGPDAAPGKGAAGTRFVQASK
jgi:AraC-like DNA-binding protein